jgi:hypothetical protein
MFSFVRACVGAASFSDRTTRFDLSNYVFSIMGFTKFLDLDIVESSF